MVLTSSTKTVSSRKLETKTKCLILWCWRPLQSLYLPKIKCQSKLQHQFPYVLNEHSTRHLSRKSAEIVSPSITISAVNIRCTYLDVIKHHTWRRRLIHVHPVKGWQHSLWWHIYWFIWSVKGWQHSLWWHIYWFIWSRHILITSSDRYIHQSVSQNDDYYVS